MSYSHAQYLNIQQKKEFRYDYLKGKICNLLKTLGQVKYLTNIAGIQHMYIYSDPFSSFFESI